MSEEQQAQPPVETAAAQPVAAPDDLRQQLEALKAKNFELINEQSWPNQASTKRSGKTRKPQSLL